MTKKWPAMKARPLFKKLPVLIALSLGIWLASCGTSPSPEFIAVPHSQLDVPAQITGLVRIANLDDGKCPVKVIEVQPMVYTGGHAVHENGDSPYFPESTADETGLTALIARLGAGSQPTGANVEVGQVEGDAGDGWAPDPSTPAFAGKTFTMVSPNPVYSTHATGVGHNFYGNSASSISSGITDINCYELIHWANDGFLNYTGPEPPDLVTLDIFNNSWISTSANSNVLLRKSDYAVNAQGLIFSNGVNNGTGPLDYPLVNFMFNGIAVGRSTGQHHAGDTGLGLDGPGRMKPDIVAPANYTSLSTPLVAGGAALMLQTARTHPLLIGDPNAQHPEVIRAVLMAGAEHRSGWTNNAVAGGPLRGTTTQPLDALYGADELDVNHAHWILTGGKHQPAAAPAQAVHAPHAGWALVDIPAGASRWWRFHVGSTRPFVSILAVWHRRVADDFASYTIPDADLELWRMDPVNGPATLVGDPGLPYFAGGNVQSTSPDDNVEHLYISGLQPGDYMLELRRAADGLPSWNIAVAWELACLEGPVTPAVTGAGYNFCPESTVTLTTGSSNGYQWRHNGAAIQGAAGQSYAATVSGNYTVTILTAAGCEGTSAGHDVLIEFCPGSEVSPPPAIYPARLVKNPSSSTGYYLYFQSLDALDGYNLYEGAIGSYYSHANAPGNVCALAAEDLGTGEVRAAITPSAGNRYYLVTAFGGGSEGPSGFSSSNVEIPAGQSTCAP